MSALLSTGLFPMSTLGAFACVGAVVGLISLFVLIGLDSSQSGASRAGQLILATAFIAACFVYRATVLP